MVDVDVPTTWPPMLQSYFWARTGPAAAVRKGYAMTLSGGVVWKDPTARDHWGKVIDDPRFTGRGPLGAGTTHAQTHCQQCGTPRTDTPFCPQCGTRQA